MRIKEGFELQERSGQYFVAAKSGYETSMGNTIMLTETAVFLWNLLNEREVTKTEMLDALIGNFDISTVLALGDIDVFVRTMKENGVIE